MQLTAAVVSSALKILVRYRYPLKSEECQLVDISPLEDNQAIFQLGRGQHQVIERRKAFNARCIEFLNPCLDNSCARVMVGPMVHE